MENEYVYFITNPYYDKNIIKIGWTKNNPIIRIKTLSNPTGVPGAFNIEYIIKTHCGMGYNLEQQIHKYLKKYRINKQREFFRIDKEDLVNILVNELNLEIIYVSINNTEETNTEETNTEENNTEENNTEENNTEENNTEENTITNNEEPIVIIQSKKLYKLNDSNINRENHKHFHCSTCNYSTINKYDYNKHLFTQKHIKLNTTKEEITNTNKFICSCGKEYKYDSGYYRHKKKCKYQQKLENNNEKNITSELVLELIKNNNELTNAINNLMKMG